MEQAEAARRSQHAGAPRSRASAPQALSAVAFGLLLWAAGNALLRVLLRVVAGHATAPVSLERSVGLSLLIGIAGCGVAWVVGAEDPVRVARWSAACAPAIVAFALVEAVVLR